MSENANVSFFINNSTNGSSLPEERIPTLDLLMYGKIFAGLDLSMAPFIIVGNILVLVAVCSEVRLQTISNAFIASLAVADLLVGVLTIPLYSLFYLRVGNLEKNKYVCLIRNSVAIYSCGSSLLNLLLLSFDRYIAIIYPLRYAALMTPKRAKLAVSVLWIFSTVLSFLPMGWHNWSHHIPCDLYAVSPRWYIIIAVYIQVLGCLTFTTLMYIRIFYTALRHHKQIRQENIFASVTLRKRQERDFKSAKVMSLVLLLFVMFWLPYMASSALKHIKSISWDLAEVIKSFTLCLSFSNSMVNPIVYALLKKDFRAVFKKFLFKCCVICRIKYAENEDSVSHSISTNTVEFNLQTRDTEAIGLGQISFHANE